GFRLLEARESLGLLSKGGPRQLPVPPNSEGHPVVVDLHEDDRARLAPSGREMLEDGQASRMVCSRDLVRIGRPASGELMIVGRGVGPASRFHASSPSNMNACGNIRIATLFARPLALATSNSEIHGNDRTSSTRPFARMSSTAVIDHSVGTSRRRSFVPSRPTEKTRVIWLWEIPCSYRSVTAAPARRSVSETWSSTRRGTDGIDVSSTFANPHDPTSDRAGDAPNRFVVGRSRRSSNHVRTRPR